MSRLTASPFHKPSPFEFPRVPLSPPENMSDHLGSAHPTNISVIGAMPLEPHHVEAETALHSQSPPETAGARFRRVSSLAYHNSGLRESRERTVQRSSKYFIIVLPPPSVLQEQGQLGHTLSLGPRHRLSQGMLMPLFPTMYGQLSAIAKEFNFPSTAGICLYLHFTENGFTATPRISDDSWQMIWNSMFDHTNTSPRVPIVGKVEFDIDIRYARWYSAWIASAHRDHLDVPASVGPSTAAPSVAHFRGDSRTTDLEFNFDDPLDSESVSPNSRPGRHVPRKLSLVDRLDASLRAVARVTPNESPEHSASIRALSPIFQEDEPKTAKLVDSLEKRVNSWRASASLTPGALASKGQTSLEPANLPNAISLDNEADEEGEELNLEDFTWSVSSLGPNDWEDGSVASGYRLPSVHLAQRMESSVCMTPSDCTSFGPSDYTLPSPVPSFERVLTPDIAYRMYEDRPLTPSTATSWGPASEYLPSSPMSFGRAPSLHLGDRMVFSPPPTPSTATSWGPASWPASPVTPFYVRTPDAGQRAFDPDDLVPSVPWEHVWPYQQAATSKPWGHAWPYQRQPPVATSKPWGHAWPYQRPVATSKPWGHVWPYQRQPPVATSKPWGHVWPYQRQPPVTTESKPWGLAWPYITDRVVQPWGHSWPYRSYANQRPPPISVHLPCTYPALNIYPAVYPVFEIYPSTVSSEKSLISVYPHFDIYPAVSGRQQSNNLVHVKVKSAYPDFEIYPSIIGSKNTEISLGPCGYPDFLIYSPVKSAARPRTDSVTSNYPLGLLNIYPPVYPHSTIPYPSTHAEKARSSGYPTFDLYPVVESAAGRKRPTDVVVRFPWAYPIFDLYPAVYPFVNPYPASTTVVIPRRSFGYPTFKIYPAIERISSAKSVIQYPFFDLYPAVEPTKGSSASGDGKRTGIIIRFPWAYPIFDLYPAVYPFVNPYPASTTADIPRRSFGYPTFEIYSAIEWISSAKSVIQYPFFDLYPAIEPAKGSTVSDDGKQTDIVVRFPWAYPIFDLYPAVYPFVNPYPASTTVVIPRRSFGYPTFKIYPAVERLSLAKSVIQYPFFDLYPAIEPAKRSSVSDDGKRTGIMVRFPWAYPIFDLYPAVYPFVNPYPTSTTFAIPRRSFGYPTFKIYTATEEISPAKSVIHYPSFNLYPDVEPIKGIEHSSLCDSKPSEAAVRFLWSYPIFELYPPVYPYVAPYPLGESARPKELVSKSGRSRQYPNFVLYPCRQYPDFDLYAALDHKEKEDNRVLECTVRYPVFNL
ncbi:hypothetical protein BDP27DRAFT_1446230, partial [Rhodocollybia butyracea]